MTWPYCVVCYSTSTIIISQPLTYLYHRLLLNEDALSFQLYLESLIDSNTYNEAGNLRQNQSPWMLTDAAHIIFHNARQRCYTVLNKADLPNTEDADNDDEDAWEALRELEGGYISQKKTDDRPSWLPKNIHAVLEELPKWSLVAAALQEIEEEMMRRESTLTAHDPGSNTVLIMTSSVRTAELLREFLDTMNADRPAGEQGRGMMLSRLRFYLARQTQRKKGKGGASGTTSRGEREANGNGGDDDDVSPALRKKDKERQERQANRRRVRGGAPTAGSSRTGAAESDNGTSEP